MREKECINNSGKSKKGMKNLRGRNSIVKQIVIAFLIPIVFVILVGYLSYNQAQKGIREKYEEAAMTTVWTTAQYIDLGFSLVEAEALKYAFDSSMNEYYMGLCENNAQKKTQVINTIQSGMKSAKATNAFISNIHIVTQTDIKGQTTKQLLSGTGEGFYDEFTAELTADGKNAANSAWIAKHDILDSRFALLPEDYICAYYAPSSNSRAGIVVDVSRETVYNVILNMELGEGSIRGFIAPDGVEITTTEECSFVVADKELYEKLIRSEDAKICVYEEIDGKEYLLLVAKGTVGKTMVYAAVPRSMVEAAAQGIKILTVVMVIISCVVAGIIGFLIIKRMNKRMKAIFGGIHQASEGDLTANIVLNGNDEFTDIAGSINYMIQSMRKLVTGFNDTVLHVADTVEEVKAASGTINNRVGNIKNAIAEIDTGLTRQKDNADDCQQKMDTLSEEIKTVLSEIEKIETVADDNHEMIERGLSQMLALSVHSENTTRVTDSVTENVLQLSQKMESIKQFVGVINGISGQTNLLSLNASIEAARAGASGRGFAVVAEEIRKLADESLVAAEQVGAIVRTIEAQMEETTINASEAHKDIQRQAQFIVDMKAILDNMEQGMEGLMSSIENISKNIEKVDANRHSTKKEVAKITEVIHETSTFTSQMNEQAADLLHNTETMDSVSERLIQNTQELEQEMKRFMV